MVDQINFYPLHPFLGKDLTKRYQLCRGLEADQQALCWNFFIRIKNIQPLWI
jgi:hypothetical protein